MPSYYDIDTILAEEELLTVKPKFAFAYLSHLDPDSHHRNSSSSSTTGRKRPRADDTHHHRLPEGTKIKMPLWAVDRWAMLNFVKIPILPKHYRQRMKERLEADAVQMNLSTKSDHYFLSGMLLINLLLRTVHVHKRNSATNSRTASSSSRAAADAESQAMEQLSYDARSLQSALLTAMMGDRLCRNFDYTLSALDAMEDDVSDWICRLSALERYMFLKGVESSGAVKTWREVGCSRLSVSLAVVKGRSLGVGGKKSGNSRMTPNNGVGSSGSFRGVGEKKRVVTPNLG